MEVAFWASKHQDFSMYVNLLWQDFSFCAHISIKLNTMGHFEILMQGSKIALVRSYLRVPQAAGQAKILIFLVKINFFP